MTISQEWPPSGRKFDLCIIGAGPAGLAIALECESKGLSTLLVEAGGLRPCPLQSGVEAEILDLRHHAPLRVTTRQAFGGTSWAWGGGCLPLDPIDFESRPYVAESGWPISYEDLRRWYGSAAAYMDCGSPDFSLAAPGWESLQDFSAARVQRLARRTRLARAYAPSIRNSQRIWLSLRQDVIGLELDGMGERVVGLRLAGPPVHQISPEAQLYVLACGGLQTTKLLLELQTQWPQHFGNKDGPLGRFYMGHVVGEIATIVFKEPGDARQFLFNSDAGGIFNLRHFRLNDDRQKSAGVSNTLFALRSPPLVDHRHKSGVLSLALLVGRIPPVRAALGSDRLEATAKQRAISVRKHIRNMLEDSHMSARELTRLIYQRLALTPNVPFIPENPSGRYALRYHAEQVPNSLSRVRLTRQRDDAGRPRLSVDFRFTEQDGQSVLLAHEIFDRSLRLSGKAHLEYSHLPEERLADVMEMASDGFHQIGTTRMGNSPRAGIVDASCRAHGFKNLFLASSSVFPTSGSANPTFAIAALAFRLAHHLTRLARISHAG